MKRSILISFLIVVALMASSIMAQDAAPRSMKYGLKAGLGMANLTGDIEGNATKMGFGFGLFLTYQASPTIAVQPELLYVMKGTKDDETDAKLKIDYIEVPVLFKYMIPTQGKIAPNFFAGPFIGFKASAKVEDVDAEGIKSTDFGVTFGGGIDIASGATGVFTIDARYDLGLSNINDVGEASVKTSNIAVFLGYGF